MPYLPLLYAHHMGHWPFVCAIALLQRAHGARHVVCNPTSPVSDVDVSPVSDVDVSPVPNYWNEQFPPDEWELRRNSVIRSYQGNDNPFILDHTLAARVDW